MINEFLMAPQGWQCPICKRIYSPMTLMCYYCGGEQKTITYATNTEKVEIGTNTHQFIPIHPQKQTGDKYD